MRKLGALLAPLLALSLTVLTSSVASAAAIHVIYIGDDGTRGRVEKYRAAGVDVTADSAERLDTPSLDAMATNGIRFDNFRVYGNCSPTRAAFMGYGEIRRRENLYGHVTGTSTNVILRVDPYSPMNLIRNYKRIGFTVSYYGKLHLSAEFTPTYGTLGTTDTFIKAMGADVAEAVMSLNPGSDWGQPNTHQPDNVNDCFGHNFWVAYDLDGTVTTYGDGTVGSSGYSSTIIANKVKDRIDWIQNNDADGKHVIFVAWSAPHAPWEDNAGSDGEDEVCDYDGSSVSVTQVTLTRSGSTATFTTASAHGLSVGELVYVTGAVDVQFNSEPARISRVSAFEFDYTCGAIGATSTTGASYIRYNEYADDRPPDSIAVGDVAVYNDAFEYIDTMVGEINAELHLAAGGSEDLAVFFYDNGAPGAGATTECGDSEGMKGTPFPCGQQVPLLMQGAGLVSGTGQVIDELMHITDLPKTLIDLAGGTYHGQIDGKSFADCIDGTVAAASCTINRDVICYEEWLPNGGNTDGTILRVPKFGDSASEWDRHERACTTRSCGSTNEYLLRRVYDVDNDSDPVDITEFCEQMYVITSSSDYTDADDDPRAETTGSFTEVNGCSTGSNGGALVAGGFTSPSITADETCALNKLQRELDSMANRDGAHPATFSGVGTFDSL